MGETEEERKKDLQKRQAVFTKPRRKVLMKILAMGPIPGLPRRNRDEAMINATHATEAICRGLDPFLYRDKPDTGFCLFQKEEGVRINGLISQLGELGLQCTDAYWQLIEGKGPVNTLVFSSGEITPVRLSDEVVEVLGRRFNHCTIWCNLNVIGRLDTINLAKGRKTDEPSRTLVIRGSTYRLV